MPRPDIAFTRGGAQRRSDIIDAAAHLFTEQGYHGTSTAQIAARAGCAKATVYHYFRKKPEILFEIHDQWIEELQDRMDSRDQALPTEQFLRGVFLDILSLIASKADHVRAFFEFSRELPTDLREAAATKRDRYEWIIRERISRDIHAGKLASRHPRIATFALFGMCNWAYQWFHADGDLSAEGVAEELCSIYLKGVMPEA